MSRYINFNTVILLAMFLVVAVTCCFLVSRDIKGRREAEEQRLLEEERISQAAAEAAAAAARPESKPQEQEPAAVRPAEGFYQVTMTTEWHFAAPDAVSEDAYVENAVSNRNSVYFDIFLSGDEEHAIYRSPVIPVGSSLKGIKLDAAIDAGAHECVAVYHLVDDAQNTQSTVRVSLMIVMEEGAADAADEAGEEGVPRAAE